MYVVGTAGHVDHGKSTLVKALTGIDPDRLAEEQRREMTIDLGFAWLTLPSGRAISVIDVPGHERFIKNMLAGVGGIDAALLVIAADESVMPQTAEHLAILDLLGVERGLVVLSKADAVEADWLALVEDEVAERLRGTTLERAPRVAVSARTGQGLPELLRALDALLDATPPRAASHGAPRLPVDRSFTIGGFGTVVTGTLMGGPLEVGQEVELVPSGLRARVRGLQTHRQHEERALPGTRVAVNLAGVHHREVARGDVLALPGRLRPSDRIDVRLRLVADAPRPLAQNDPLDLFVGAAEVPCRATLLESDTIAPGESGWVQLRLQRPIAAARGDRCIVRQASPSLTLGGGSVLDAQPPRHRRFRPEVLAGLELLQRGDPADLLLQALGDGSPQEWAALVKGCQLPPDVALEALGELAAQGKVLALGEATGRQGDARRETRDARHETRDKEMLRSTVLSENAISPSPPLMSPPLPLSLVVSSAVGWERLAAKLEEALRGYHRRYPLRRGIPREELRQRLRLAPRAADAVVAEAQARGVCAASERAVWLAGFAPAPTPEQRREADALLEACRRAPFSPPAPEIDPELLAWLLEAGALVRVSDEVCLLPGAYADLVTWVRDTIARDGSVAVGQLRDHFGTSRKYGLALLEHLDGIKVTRRVGEGRVLY
jgi:selenocysteine-specific elongation factor